MKNLTKPILLVFVLALCFACSDLTDDLTGDQLKSGNLGSDKSGDEKMVTVPFKVHYLGTYMPLGDRCVTNVIVDGVGDGTHVGNSTIHFDFCILGASAGGDSIYYGGADNSYIVADNGDTLFVSIEGAVVSPPLDDHPDYVVNYWRDPFSIEGGTGRFEGATGGGWSDDYNSFEDDYSHHFWEGTITMKKGKR